MSERLEANRRAHNGCRRFRDFIETRCQLRSSAPGLLSTVHAPLSPAAADQAYEPDDGKHDDGDPDQVDQRARRVEQEPEDEKDDRSDEEQMDHLKFTSCVLPWALTKVGQGSGEHACQLTLDLTPSTAPAT